MPAIAATTRRPIVQGLHLQAEAPPHPADQTRNAPPRRRRTGDRPSQKRAPHGPQLSPPPRRRRQQCHPRRSRLQLQPPSAVAQIFIAHDPRRPERHAPRTSRARRRLSRVLHGGLFKPKKLACKNSNSPNQSRLIGEPTVCSTDPPILIGS